MALFSEYLFTEGAGGTVSDSSGNGRTLTVSAGTWVAGVENSALASGAGGTNGAVRDQANPTTAITLMGYVNPSILSGVQSAINFSNGGSTMAAIFIRRDDFGPIDVVQGNIRVGGSLLTLNGGDSVPVGVWTHLAMTFDGTTRVLYINGEPVDSQIGAGTIGIAAVFAVAGYVEVLSAANLSIDEVRVFDTALTQAEIQAFLTGGSDMFEPTLVGNGSLADRILASLTDQGFLTGTITDREYARLLAKLTLTAPQPYSLSDLYALAAESNRLYGVGVDNLGVLA